jgi:predicted phosphodiesterase
MKNLIFTDAHGRSIKPLLERAKCEGVERIVGLGDYDTPQVLRELLESDLDKIVVIGNHEYHYIRGLPIESGLMRGDLVEYALRWFNTPERKYLEEAIKKPNKNRGLIVTRTIEKKRYAFSHSSLTKARDWEIGFPLCFWKRITNASGALEEFKLMKKQKIDLMFRGHDHYSGFYTLKTRARAKVQQRLFEQKLFLEPNARHIVCVGPYYHGEYCLFDDKTQELEFVDSLGMRLKGP